MTDATTTTPANGQIVIVGAGQAGTLVAESLRNGGYLGGITLLGDEPHGPYHRPPLSKAWLAGDMQAEQLTLRAPAVLANKHITLRTGVEVARIDRVGQQVHLASGEYLPYTGLALTTGACARSLDLPGMQARNVLPLRSRDDASAMAALLVRCQQQAQGVVVIGGGFIGLEVAATARKKGLAVTVLEAAPRLLGRVLSQALSDWFAQLHRGNGVEVVLNARLQGLNLADNEAHSVSLADGRAIPCGLVVLGVGVQANDGLAQQAGLACERGVIVDACGRTADPLIVAAGDCTARRLPDGGLLRLESVQNATEGAKAAAAALLGQERPFTAVPWFWSDQFDKKLQMAGLSAGAETWAVRGDMTSGAPFSIYQFQAGRLLAVDSINAPKDHMQARKLLQAGVSPTLDQAADLGFDLNTLLA
jgi:3-phenylpropionate/trans-cinnamate dioxygenase ferredoxin reductase component